MKVIVNADDFGLSEDVNRAVEYCFKKSIISSTTILTNFPSFTSAVRIAYDSNFNDAIGLHFNIVEGTPLSESILRCQRFCTKGKFSYKRNSAIFLNRKEVLAIRQECESQIKRLLESGITPTHFDSHTHSHTEIPIFLAIIPILKKYNIRNIRRPLNYNVKHDYKWFYKLMYASILKLCGFRSTDYFCSFFDNRDVVLGFNQSIEFMLHPLMRKGFIVDSVLNKEIRENTFSKYFINYSEL